MITFKSKDSFLEKKFNYLFTQYNLFNLNSQKNYILIDLMKNNDQLIVEMNNEKINFNLPLSFSDFFVLLKKKLINISISNDKIEFYPFKNLVIYQNLDLYLKDIHNIIFSNLIISIDDGINKIDLYKTLWPHDKDISMNKLDTHLTNLKNEIYDGLQIDLKFSSKNNFIKLVIN